MRRIAPAKSESPTTGLTSITNTIACTFCQILRFTNISLSKINTKNTINENIRFQIYLTEPTRLFSK